MTMIKSEDLVSALKNIAPFQSKEITRYYLNGIYFHVTTDEITMVATNGTILCEIKITNNTDNSFETFSFIVPTQMVKTLITSFEKDQGDLIDIDYSDMIFHFEGAASHTRISGKEVDGTYPTYQNVIPEDLELRATASHLGFNPRLLAKAIKPFGKNPIQIKSGKDGGAQVITSPAVDGVRTLIMPMRL